MLESWKLLCSGVGVGFSTIPCGGIFVLGTKWCHSVWAPTALVVLSFSAENVRKISTGSLKIKQISVLCWKGKICWLNMKGCIFIFRRQLWHLVLVVRKCYPPAGAVGPCFSAYSPHSAAPSMCKNSLLESASWKFWIYGTSQIPMVSLFVSSFPQEGGEDRGDEWKRGMWSHRWPQHGLLLLLWAKTLDQSYSWCGEGCKSIRNCPSHPQNSLYRKT